MKAAAGILALGTSFLVGGLQAQEQSRLVGVLPPEVAVQVPAETWEQVARGEIPWQEFAASLGMEVRPQAAAEVLEKRFVVHWLYHYTGLSAAIGEDPVGEATISGRCSYLPLTDAPGSPAMYPSYWWDTGVTTNSWQAPADSATCTTDRTDITFYKLTWVKSP
ncbi:hypothetical protein HRbin09_01235 [bacterium HR09]|nr:hypothetical protein HRbin09_01235 [bacterium HR09]